MSTTTKTSSWQGGRKWRYESVLLACLLVVAQHHALSLSPSGNNKKVKLANQGSRSFQNRSPMKMSDAAMVFSDFGRDRDDGLSKVRERIFETSDQLARSAASGIKRRKYKRKLIPETEKEKRRLQLVRQAEYRQLIEEAKAEGGRAPSIWSFESLFPNPVLDEMAVERDLYSIKDQDRETMAKAAAKKKPARSRTASGPLLSRAPQGSIAAAKSAEVLRFLGEPELKPPTTSRTSPAQSQPKDASVKASAQTDGSDAMGIDTDSLGVVAAPVARTSNSTVLAGGKVDRSLTRLVEDKMYGYRRTQTGQFQYETSLMGDGAIQFRNGVRLGNPLPVNADRLSWMAKEELRHGRIEESKELYERVVHIDPRDGRGYLGLSRCAERRRDFKLARDWLRAGIQNSATKQSSPLAYPDSGGNPYLLQALGRLEELRGHLSMAESLYVQAARSRPYHAAAWVSLAQLRTRKLGQTVAAGRVCYETAERELKKAGVPASSHVYTAWASLEYKGAGDVRRARQLFQMALEVDPKCSAAWLQLGVMEADNENWDEAEKCFEKVLTFDQRNSRVMQAYALMETKRPGGSSRKAIDLFERALKANPRDAGVLQPYAIYVAELGDMEAARELFRRGTVANKRHAPVWQAWGVLEMRMGHPEEARNIFQQGIWACAQLAGNQSGGYHCARLWQAWGVLEAKEGDYAAARRCFSRALDADSRNVAAMTAWTQMEEDIGNLNDARLLFESALKNFAPGSDAKMTIWRAYELMEQRAGNVQAAQHVYQRSVRESFNVQEDKTFIIDDRGGVDAPVKNVVRTKDKEVEVSRWNGLSSLKGEVWLNDGSIETKIPMPTMQKGSQRK